MTSIDDKPTRNRQASGKDKKIYVSQLALTGFRNYDLCKLELNPGLVVLVGDNGAGKTNLLEAVSLLAPGRGLRMAPFTDLARIKGSGNWAVSASVHGPQGMSRIGTGIEIDQETNNAPRSRIVRINETSVRGTSALGEMVRVLWLTPAMDRLFSGPAGDRRRFLDRLVLAIDPEHGSRANIFEKAMRERNKVLVLNNSDPAWLDGLEEQMAQSGIAIAAARNEAISILAGLLGDGDFMQKHGFPNAVLSLEGELEQSLKINSAVDVEDEYRKVLIDSREMDRAAGRTLNGPHKSDLNVRHGIKNEAAKNCSTGEQKALLISIILAQARIVQQMFEGYAPLLLLDEIAAHLDIARRNALLEMLNNMNVQAWMTGTDKNLFETAASSAQVYLVNEGQVEKD